MPKLSPCPIRIVSESDGLQNSDNDDHVGTVAAVLDYLDKNYNKVIAVDVDEIGNVGTGEDDLISFTLPADRVKEEGQSIRIKAFGSTATNGNAKTIKLYLGETELTNAEPHNSNAEHWEIAATIIRTGSSSGKSTISFLSNNSQDNTVDYKEISEDWSTDLVIKCTGEGTSNNDIVQEGLIVEYRP